MMPNCVRFFKPSRPARQGVIGVKIGRTSDFRQIGAAAGKRRRPGKLKSLVSNAGRRLAKGSPRRVRSIVGNSRALRFKSARGSISSARRRLNSSLAPIDRLAWRGICWAAPGKVPKSMPRADGCAGINAAGAPFVRKGNGAIDEPEDTSSPASAAIETASATARHHGATAPKVQVPSKRRMIAPCFLAGTLRA